MNTFDIIQRASSESGAIVTPGAPAIPLPEARCPGGVTVRPAVEGDLQFIDYLQKMHGHMVGFAPMKQLQAHVEKGEILIAEQAGIKASRDQGNQGQPDVMPQCLDASMPRPISMPGSLDASMPAPVGYCISKYQYKRDDIGIVYQLNVLPMQQRSLIGATLVKATFDRAPYGVRLFCCWCAQDIQANWFWESIGFIPLAFRTGSRAKQRIQIFWQRRIREGDETTPYWFPYKTENGAVREDRIAIPIPPGTHWRDAKPVLLPNQAIGNGQQAMGDMPKQLPGKLPGGALVKPRAEQPPAAKVTKAQVAAIARSKSKHLGGVPAGKAAVISKGGVRYIERADGPTEEELIEQKKPKKPRNGGTPRQKNDPVLVAKARELRDRYLEQVNASMLLPPGACGKYDVSRQLEGGSAASPGGTVKIEQVHPMRLLDAA